MHAAVGDQDAQPASAKERLVCAAGKQQYGEIIHDSM
jgi:hypothetical protein